MCPRRSGGRRSALRTIPGVGRGNVRDRTRGGREPPHIARQRSAKNETSGRC